MTPSALNIKGGSASPISISIDDNKGITITSPKKLTLNADSEIIMKTPKSVKINGVSQINAQKTNTESGFSLETDLHFLSDNVIKDGSSNESYPDFDDEPQEGKMPDPPEPPEEKKPFNWGKLACNVLAGLAAVVAVAVVAATAGAAAPVVGAIVAGGLISGTAAVGSMAASDIRRGEVSDIKDYMAAGAREAFVGAVSGAVFGPFGTGETLGGKMLLGATTNAFESIVRQKLNGEDIDWGVVAGDGIFGGLTGGLLHYGGKALKSGSNYVKKSVCRVLSENESSLMKLAKNLDDMLRPIKVEALQMRTSNDEIFTVGIRATRGESRDAVQNTVSKIVGKAKSNIVSDVNDLLTSTSKFTKPMAKELEEGVQNNKFRVRDLNNDGYELSVLDNSGQSTTSIVIDKNGNTIKMSWTVDNMGQRGNQYKNSVVPKGMDKGHIKSIQDGAQDNCIEDSPLNIIPQSNEVNKSRMKIFENYRRDNCEGMDVITDILPDGYVRVRIPQDNIDVTYNPLNKRAKSQWPDDWFIQGGTWD